MARTGTGRVRRWCRAPLLHFLLIGTAVYLAYTWLSPRSGQDRIVISQALIDGLCRDYSLRTGSAPSPVEKQALIENLVDDEVLIREALAMGIDQGDPILRRRLIQKMGFLIEGVNPVPEPSEADLQDYLERNPERFVREGRVSLSHVFLQHSGSADPSETEVERLLEVLSSGVDPGRLGDPFVHGTRFVRRSRKELAAKFGHRFAETVMTVQEGVWCGPIRSSYGFHLVLITERTEAEEPNLERVRLLVLQQLKAERQKEIRRQAIRRLRDRYVVEVRSDAGS